MYEDSKSEGCIANPDTVRLVTLGQLLYLMGFGLSFLSKMDANNTDLPEVLLGSDVRLSTK